MISGILRAVSLFLSGWVINLIYGKKGVEYYKTTGKNIYSYCTGISLLILFEILCIFFLILGIGTKDTLICVLMVIVVPIIFLIWGIIARHKIKKYIDSSNFNLSPEEKQKKEFERLKEVIESPEYQKTLKK